MTSESTIPHEANLWVADSGATVHVTPNRQLLSNFLRFEKPREIYTGGSSRFASGMGDFAYSQDNRIGRIKDVLLVIDFPTNLISLLKLAEKGCTVEIMNKQEAPLVIKRDDQVLLVGERLGKFLALRLD